MNQTSGEQDLQAVLSALGLAREAVQILPLGQGLINRTFLLSQGERRWVLQRINPQVFPHPERNLRNLAQLSRYRQAFQAAGIQFPTLIPSPSGDLGVQAPDGAYWRRLAFIPGQSLKEIKALSQAAEIGRLLGAFHRIANTLPPSTLQITLPDFHRTPRYVDRLFQVVAEIPKAQRAAVSDCMDFVQARLERISVLEAADLPQRIMHGDPKLDNILFDARGERALALIDLDTVQPGSVLYDLGDCLRSCARRPSGPQFDLGIAQALLRAYARETRGLLIRGEIQRLFDALSLIPLELGIRFLTDHLEGNRWFRIRYSGENLDKARVQFALSADIEAKAPQLQALIQDCDWSV